MLLIMTSNYECPLIQCRRGGDPALVCKISGFVYHHDSVDRSSSATHGSDSRPGPRLAVFESNPGGGLGRRFVGSGAVDAKDLLTIRDIGNVLGYETTDSMRYTRKRNN
jgi:hypothetical protein